MTKEDVKKAMQPIADGLFGKQRTSYGQMPHYTVRPVEMIVEDLCAIPEEEWAYYAFSREPLNGKFSDAERLELTKQAIACGRAYASRVLVAEFREPKTIHIFMDGVRKGEELFAQHGVSAFMGEGFALAKLLLGHEIFHFVEEKYRKEIWTRTYRIRLWNVGPVKNTSTVMVLGEIAAMAFAKALTEITFSPYVLDAFLVYGYSPEAASGLYEEMMEKSGRTPRLPETENAASED